MKIYANSRLSVAVNVNVNESDNSLNIIELVLPLAYRDTIEVDLLAAGFPHDIVHYASNSLHIGEKAIIDEALQAMQNHFQYKERFYVKIHKRIPTGYGLGSGASNAWQIMRAVAKLLKLKTTDNELLTIAQTLKHDIAYFHTNEPALFNKETQQATIINMSAKFYILLLMPNRIVNKQKIMTNYKNLKSETSAFLALNNATITNLDDLNEYLINDFLEAALQIKEINYLYESLKNAKVDYYGLAGRGTTLFVLSESRSIIRKLRDYYRKQNYEPIITSLYLKEMRR